MTKGKPKRVFTPQEIADIINRYKSGELLKEIAKAHNTGTSTISDIARRNDLPKRWSNRISRKQSSLKSQAWKLLHYDR